MENLEFVTAKECNFDLVTLLMNLRGKNLNNEEYEALVEKREEVLNQVSDKLGWEYRQEVEDVYSDMFDYYAKLFYSLGKKHDKVTDVFFFGDTGDNSSGNSVESVLIQ